MRGKGRVISGALVSVGVCSALTVAAASAGAGPAAAAAAGGSGTHPVIIFLKNQFMIEDRQSGQQGAPP